MIAETDDSLRQLQQQRRITESMPIEEYLAPENKAVQDSPDDVFKQIAQQFDPPEEEDSEEET